MKKSDDWMIKIIYFDERELLVKRKIETNAPKPKSPNCYPNLTKHASIEINLKFSNLNDESTMEIKDDKEWGKTFLEPHINIKQINITSTSSLIRPQNGLIKEKLNPHGSELLFLSHKAINLQYSSRDNKLINTLSQP